jgi:hypothetical protein
MVRAKWLLEYGAGQFADGTSENRQPSRAAMQISSPSRDFRAANEPLIHPQHLGNGFGVLADVGFGIRRLRFFHGSQDAARCRSAPHRMAVSNRRHVVRFLSLGR